MKTFIFNEFQLFASFTQNNEADININNIPVPLNQLAKLLDMVCIINDHMVQFVYLYHFPHIFYTIEMYYLFNRKQ